MSLLTPFAVKLGGLGVAQFVRLVTASLDRAVAYYDPTADPAHPDFRGPAIFLFWHEYIILPFGVRGHCDIAMLLSRHRDAEWLSRAAQHMGFDTIRGSTYRGGGTALRQLMGKSQSKNLAITPDGPRGPRRKMAQGPVYLSSRLQIPLIPMGIGYDRPWRLPTWDQFAVPRPYSRGRVVVGPAIQIPGQLDRSAVEHYRQRAEQLLERLTWEAEAWAEAGSRKSGQLPLNPAAKPLWSRRRSDRTSELRRCPPLQLVPTPPNSPAAAARPQNSLPCEPDSGRRCA